MTPPTHTTGPEPIELRLAQDRDMRSLLRLADRDTRPLPPGPLLIAIRASRVDAALSTTTGEVVADPFVRTAQLVALLRCHARAMPSGPTGNAHARRGPRLRVRPVTA